jgi:hypothetical protein
VIRVEDEAEDEEAYANDMSFNFSTGIVSAFPQWEISSTAFFVTAPTC